MSRGFMRGFFRTIPRPPASVGVLLLCSLLVPGPYACESSDPAPRAKSPSTGEVFEAFDSGAIIEEETIAAPPAPVPAPGTTLPPAPENAGRDDRRLPLSSPGAAPPDAVPTQPQSTD